MKKFLYLYLSQVLVQNNVIFVPSVMQPLVSRNSKTKPAQQIRIHWVQLIVLPLSYVIGISLGKPWKAFSEDALTVKVGKLLFKRTCVLTLFRQGGWDALEAPTNFESL